MDIEKIWLLISGAQVISWALWVTWPCLVLQAGCSPLRWSGSSPRQAAGLSPSELAQLPYLGLSHRHHSSPSPAYTFFSSESILNENTMWYTEIKREMPQSVTIPCACECWVASVMSDALWLAPLSMEFSRQEYWSGLPFPSPGDLPNSGIEPTSSVAPALPVNALLLNHQGSPQIPPTSSYHQKHKIGSYKEAHTIISQLFRVSRSKFLLSVGLPSQYLGLVLSVLLYWMVGALTNQPPCLTHFTYFRPLDLLLVWISYSNYVIKSLPSILPTSHSFPTLTPARFNQTLIHLSATVTIPLP